MTVKELKEELNHYDEDMDIVFHFSDDVEVDSWTENKYGEKSVYINVKFEPSFIGTVQGSMFVDMVVKEENKE